MHRSHPSISRRKHLIKEMMEDDFALPTDQQKIVRVVSSRGNNLHEVEAATNEENFLGECGIGESSHTDTILKYSLINSCSIHAQQIPEKYVGEAR